MYAWRLAGKSAFHFSQTDIPATVTPVVFINVVHCFKKSGLDLRRQNFLHNLSLFYVNDLFEAALSFW